MGRLPFDVANRVFANDYNDGNCQTGPNGAFEHKGLFPEVSNGRGPPVFDENEKAADAPNVHGPNQNQSSQDPSSFARPGLPGKPSFANSGENVDEAIKELNRAWMSGLISDEDYAEADAALRKVQGFVAPHPAGLKHLTDGPSKWRWPRRKRQVSPDREASRQRTRMLAGGGYLPEHIRKFYTESERAVWAVISRESKRHGICDLAVDALAALSGTCRRTVQYTVSKAVMLGHLSRQERPRTGAKHDTNVLKIVCADIWAWLKRAVIRLMPSFIGRKKYAASSSIDSKERVVPQPVPRVARILRLCG